MKAVVQDRYGPPEVLYLADVERPQPKAGEVLVRIVASTVSQSDTHLRGAHPWIWRLIMGVRRPRRRTLGVEFAGVVDAVGPGVREFRIGDEAFGSRWFGAHAEFICMAETAAIVHKPAALGFEEAAAIYDGGSQALSALRLAEAGPGRRILIYGASGSLGSAAVQIAKQRGAHVTAVCGTAHVDVVRALGADLVIDRQTTDFRATGQTWDAFIDAVGKYAFRWARRSIRPGGVYVATDVGPRPFEMMVAAILTRRIGSRRLRFASGRRSREDALELRELVETGAYRPLIDRVYPMAEVQAAHRHVEAWHKTGNVVLRIDPEV